MARFLAITFCSLAFFLTNHVLKANGTEWRQTTNGSFYEGTRVELICTIHSSQSINITFRNNDGNDYRIVENSTLTDPSTYQFSWTANGTGTVFNLTITSVRREDEGMYTCSSYSEESTPLHLGVFYGPRGKAAACKVSHDSSSYLIDGEQHPQFDFNCTSQDGKPPVLIELFINDRNYTQDTIIINKTIEGKLFKTLSFSKHLNNSYNNSEFECRVTQVLPPPDTSYTSICHSAPLVMSQNFEIVLTRGDNVENNGRYETTVSCKSNVHGVDIQWVDLPSGLKYTKERNEEENEILLKITDFGEKENLDYIIRCKGKLGNRERIGETILYSDNSRTTTPESFINLFIAGVGIVIICITFICCFCFMNRRSKEMTSQPRSKTSNTEKSEKTGKSKKPEKSEKSKTSAISAKSEVPEKAKESYTELEIHKNIQIDDSYTALHDTEKEARSYDLLCSRQSSEIYQRSMQPTVMGEDYSKRQDDSKYSFKLNEGNYSISMEFDFNEESPYYTVINDTYSEVANP